MQKFENEGRWISRGGVRTRRGSGSREIREQEVLEAL